MDHLYYVHGDSPYAILRAGSTTVLETFVPLLPLVPLRYPFLDEVLLQLVHFPDTRRLL